MTNRLETRADFEKLQQTARQRWDALWQGDQLVGAFRQVLEGPPNNLSVAS